MLERGKQYRGPDLGEFAAPYQLGFIGANDRKPTKMVPRRKVCVTRKARDNWLQIRLHSELRRDAGCGPPSCLSTNRAVSSPGPPGSGALLDKPLDRKGRRAPEVR